MQTENVAQSDSFKIDVVHCSCLAKQKEGSNNEDFIYVNTINNLYIIADGVSGGGNGWIASRLAVQGVVAEISALLNNPDVNPEKLIKNGIERVNETIMHPLAVSKVVNGLRGFGTTLDVLYYRNNNIYIGHVGDSRVYLFRTGNLEQLTNDNSIFEVDKSNQGESKILTTSLTSVDCLGFKEHPKLEIIKREIQKGDIVLMATDGLTDLVHESEIKNILSGSKFNDIINWLVSFANEPEMIAKLYAKQKNISVHDAQLKYGGKDDISIILLKFFGGNRQ